MEHVLAAIATHHRVRPSSKEKANDSERAMAISRECTPTDFHEYSLPICILGIGEVGG
jgi:hypothetical protein